MSVVTRESAVTGMSSSRLRVLSVASACPCPPVGGTRILIDRQLREIAAHHEVDLVTVDCPTAAECHVDAIDCCASVRFVPLAEPERRWTTIDRLRWSSASAPFFMYQRYSEQAQALVDELVARNRYDVIIAEDNEAGLYVRASHNPPKVLTKHSLLSLQREQLAAIADSHGHRWRDHIYATLLRRRERLEANLFDMIKLPTQADRREWQRIVGTGHEPLVVTNGVDTGYFGFRQRTGPVDRLVYTASFAAAPNLDAAQTLIDDIYPRVRATSEPLVPLYIVGRSPPEELRVREREPGVTVTGAVPDIRPFLGEKAIAVIPLRVASGIINKVLEPMAMGVAVVASPLAVDGLHTNPDKVCLVARTPDEFADAIRRLCDDADLYERLTRAAHEYVMSQHSWPALMAEYRRAVEAVAVGTWTGQSRLVS